MAVKRIQKNRMDADGNLHVIHYETEASVVLMEDGTTAEAAITGKQDKLTFDQTPTAGSQNPVTSGGVKEAIDNIPTPDVSGQIASHNTAEGVHENMGWLTADDGVLFDSDKGVAGGVAALGADGKIADDAMPVHTHTKSQITDFPTSMPASDVYSWAKEANKPAYTAGEVGAAPVSHVSDGAVHITAEERAAWNGKAAGTHASQHASNGGDPITPASIGAIPSTEKGAASGVATLGADGKVPTGQLPDMDYAPSSHVSDTVKHITAEERTAWNGKASTTYVDEAIQTAIQNSWEASY